MSDSRPSFKETGNGRAKGEGDIGCRDSTGWLMSPQYLIHVKPPPLVRAQPRWQGLTSSLVLAIMRRLFFEEEAGVDGS